MPSRETAASNGNPSQYDIVRMTAYAAGQRETHEQLLAELTEHALNSPVTERVGSHETADYLWPLVMRWKDYRY